MSILQNTMAAAVQTVRIDPSNISQAWMQTDWHKWDQSICCELKQLEQMGAWELVDPPKGMNIVGSCFVFHYKHNADGEIASHKVRLVAQGFSQQESINYSETFSPTAKLSAIHIIAAIATWNDWELEQTDVDSGYLNAPLMETIYMQQPKGYEVPGKEHLVCQLLHTLWLEAGRKRMVFSLL